MTTNVDTVAGYLAWLADSRKTLMPNRPEQHRCYEQLVLDHGRAFTMRPLPDDVERGPMGNCFENTLFAAVRSGGEYGYCEGWANSSVGLPIHHAWLVDADGNAYDPTWDYDPDREYVGIAFDADWAAARSLAQGYSGLLGDNDWIYNEERLLDGIPDEALYWQ